MPGSEWRADPIPGEVERARTAVAASTDVSLDGDAVATRAPLPTPTASASLVLAPGESAGLRSDVPHHHGHFIAVSDEEVMLVDGVHRYRCARPGHVRPGGPPELDRLVSIFVRRRAIGPLHKGHRFVYAIGDDDRLLGAVDNSDTWPLRQDQLEEMCGTVGVAHEVRIFETVGDLIATLPEWAAPHVEFEVNHARQETAREWAWVITDVFIGVALLGGAISPFFLTQIGIALRVAIGSAAVMSGVLTLWARSRRRVRRSLRRKAKRAPETRRARPEHPAQHNSRPFDRGA